MRGRFARDLSQRYHFGDLGERDLDSYFSYLVRAKLILRSAMIIDNVFATKTCSTKVEVALASARVYQEVTLSHGLKPMLRGHLSDASAILRNFSIWLLLRSRSSWAAFVPRWIRCSNRSDFQPICRWMITLLFIAAIHLPTLDAQADEGLDDYNVAVSLYKRSRWKQATEEFQRFVKTYEKHEKGPMARLYLGLSLVELSEFEAARIELRKFADENRQNPNLSQALYRIGECSYLMDDLPNARTELERFVQDFPKDQMCEHALPYLGDTLLRSKDPVAALKMFDRAIEQFPTGKLIDDAKFGRARSLESLKKFDEAIQEYQQLAARKDGVRAADAQFYLGASFFERKQFPEAIAAYRSLAKDFPQSPLVPAAHLNAGYAYHQSGNFEEAIRQFELASKEKTQELTAIYWKGRSLKSFGDYSKAAEVLKVAAQMGDKNPLAESILYEQALCERSLQHPVEARQYFEQVLTRFSSGDLADDSLHALIEMSIESSDFSNAERLLERFRKDYPQSGLRLHMEMLNARLDLARAGATVRDPQSVAEANSLYDSAARRFELVMKESSIPKTKGQARYYLALTRQLQGNQVQSLEVIAPLVELALADGAKSDFADAVVLQADSYYQQQKYDSAARSAAKYLELFPKGRQVVRALSLQAMSSQNQKDTKTLAASLGRLTTEFPNHPLTLVTIQQLAEAAETAGDWTTALQLYESLATVQKDPEKRGFALRGIALSLYRQEKYLEAAEAFGRTINECPQQSFVAECSYFQADSLKKADQLDRAIALFQKLFETFPADKPALPGAELGPPLEYQYKAGLQVARIFNKSNKIAEADAAYEELLKRFPRPAELDLRLDEWALLNYLQNRFDRADAIWLRLINEVPLSPLVNSARLSLAESDLVAGRFDTAKKAFQELVESDKSPDDVKEQSLYQLVVLAVDQQRWTDVRELGNRLTSQFPNSKHRFYIAYGQVESLLANPKPTEPELVVAREQLQLLQAQITNDDVNSTIWYDRVWVLLAELNFRDKKYSEVRTGVEELERRRPKSPFLHQALEVLGRSLKQQAPPKFDEARATFERVLSDPFATKTETAAKSQFMIGETWFYQEKWNSASLAYQRVYSIYNYPEWRSAALLMSAKCDEKQNEWKPAIETYNLLIKEFPDSSVINEAKAGLEAAQKRLKG